MVAPPEPYDADRYGAEGRAVLADLHRRQVPPLVVGGTGLYLKALLHGLFEEGAPNPLIRARLRRELLSWGCPGCTSAWAPWTRPPPAASTPTTPTASSGPWR